MTTVFIEARPKGRKEGEPIEDYVVEDHADHVLHTSKTQAEAIAWAKQHGHTAHVTDFRRQPVIRLSSIRAIIPNAILR